MMKIEARSGRVDARRSARAVMLAIACAAIAASAQAGQINCTGTVEQVHVWTVGNWEGAVGAHVKGDFGAVVWMLCSLNADEASAKQGHPLFAAKEMHGATCEAVLSQLMVAQARSVPITVSFNDTIDPVFANCASVPQWGGEVRGGTEDDGGRLGAWDAFTKLAIAQ